jgi:hypothetical protein
MPGVGVKPFAAEPHGTARQIGKLVSVFQIFVSAATATLAISRRCMFRGTNLHNYETTDWDQDHIDSLISLW